MGFDNFSLQVSVDAGLPGDFNGDGVVNTEDINPFIALLTGGGEATIIPEPASLALLGMGALALMRRRR
jgi:hypothetical protein